MPRQLVSIECAAFETLRRRSLWHADCWSDAVSENEDPPGTSQASNPTETRAKSWQPRSPGTPRLGEAVWTSAVMARNERSDRACAQLTDATIYAVFPIESLPAGSQLLASWYFNDTSLDALDSAMRIDQDRTSGWIEFHIERTGSEPWPDGEYAIVVTDGTNEVQRAVITIS